MPELISPYMAAGILRMSLADVAHCVEHGHLNAAENVFGGQVKMYKFTREALTEFIREHSNAFYDGEIIYCLADIAFLLGISVESLREYIKSHPIGSDVEFPEGVSDRIRYKEVTVREFVENFKDQESRG